MTARKTTRVFAVVAAGALVLGAFTAAPAEAKKKKKKKPPVCEPYVPGEYAAEAGDLVTITDAATADAPVEVTVASGPGLGFTNAEDPAGDSGDVTHVFTNVQVDSKLPTNNLWVRIEYAPTFDYDLFLRTPEGPAVAYEADFNPATFGGPTPVGGNEGAHPEPGAGQIDGYLVADCDGFTVDVASAITPGGDVTMTLWLGEPPEEE